MTAVQRIPNGYTTTLTADCASGDATVQVTAVFTGYTTGQKFKAELHDGTLPTEIVEVTALSSFTWTITRAVESSTAQNWVAATPTYLTAVLTEQGLIDFIGDNASTGGGSTSTVTGGEAIAANLVVYSDIDNVRAGGAGYWWKADNAATAPIKVSRRMGISVTSCSGSGSTFTVAEGGSVSGFTSLSAGAGCWLSTSGAITQTKPATPGSGSQVAIAYLGEAIDSTHIQFTPPPHVNFVKYAASLAVDGTSTIEHWADASSRTRQLKGRVSVITFPTSLVAWYPMDDGSGNIVDVISGHNGTPQNTPTWSGSTLPTLNYTDYGDTTCPVLASASSQYYSVTNWLNALNLSTFTVFLDLYLAAGQTSRVFIGNYPGWVVGIDDSSSNKLKMYDGTNVLTGGTTLSSTTWYSIAFVFTGGGTPTMQMYVNGTSDGSMSAAVVTGNTGGANDIGRLSAGSQYLNGRFKNLRVYNIAASGTQITHLSNGNHEDSTTIYATAESPVIVGNWTIDIAATNSVIARFDDGSGSSADTKTTFKNRTGATRNVIMEVTL